MKKILLPEQDIIYKYSQLKKSTKELAEEYGVSFPTIRKILTKHNVKRHPLGLNLSQKIQDNIIKDYISSNISITKLAKNYNVSWKIINDILINNKITKRNILVKLSSDQEEEIVKDYLLKEISASDIARIHKLPRNRVCHILDRHSIDRNNDFLIKNKYDMDFFTRESYEKYYFFGFALGDGSLNDYNNKLYYTLTIGEKDKSILEKFCTWISANKENMIKSYSKENNHIHVRLQLSGSIWQKDWSKLGLVPRKTYNPSKLEVPEEYIKPFIIGLIDADGNIEFNRNYSINIVGHPYNMDWVISSLRLIGFDGNINEHMVKGKWKRIRIQRREDIIKLVQLLEIDRYKDIWLPRKWQKLYEYIFVNNEHLKYHRNTSSKLTKEQVIAVRKEYEEGNTTYAELAKKYNCNNIGNIVRRLCYNDIE